MLFCCTFKTVTACVVSKSCSITSLSFPEDPCGPCVSASFHRLEWTHNIDSGWLSFSLRWEYSSGGETLWWMTAWFTHWCYCLQPLCFCLAYSWYLLGHYIIRGGRYEIQCLAGIICALLSNRQQHTCSVFQKACCSGRKIHAAYIVLSTPVTDVEHMKIYCNNLCFTAGFYKIPTKNM